MTPIQAPIPSTKAHPRSRGEHRLVKAQCKDSRGSSPLARGTYAVIRVLALLGRLIPARAGNMFMRRHTLSPPSAHPRSRGEHQGDNRTIGQPNGSSPLARGTFSTSTVTCFYWRLIPARAGNIPPYGLLPHLDPAHPRSRGEHRDILDTALNLAGSSPLARGT